MIINKEGIDNMTELEKLINDAKTYGKGITNLQDKKNRMLQDILEKVKPEIKSFIETVVNTKDICKNLYEDKTLSSFKLPSVEFGNHMLTNIQNTTLCCYVNFYIFKDIDVCNLKDVIKHKKEPRFNVTEDEYMATKFPSDDICTHIRVSIPSDNNKNIVYNIINNSNEIIFDYSSFKQQFSAMVENYNKELTEQLKEKVSELKQSYNEEKNDMTLIEKSYIKFRNDYKTPILKPLPEKFYEYLKRALARCTIDKTYNAKKTYISHKYKDYILPAYQRLQSRFELPTAEIDFQKLYENNVLTFRQGMDEPNQIYGSMDRFHYNLHMNENKWDTLSYTLDTYSKLDKRKSVETDLYIKGYNLLTSEKPSIFISSELFDTINEKYPKSDMTLDLGAYYDLTPLRELVLDKTIDDKEDEEIYDREY